MEKPYVPNEYSSRESALEVCAVEICKAHPDFMVVGTYALVGKDDRRESEVQLRKGTLSVMTVAAKFQATYAGMLPPTLDKHDFPSAILDLHFHPDDKSLLGVATSAASIHFFRLVKHANILDRRLEMKLLPLGWAKIAEDDEHGLTHLVTHFAWLPAIGASRVEGVNDQLLVTLAATQSSGQVQIVKLVISETLPTSDKRTGVHDTAAKLPLTQVYLHTHLEEAWAVSSFEIPSPPGTHNRFLLSGGDDSALRTSLLNFALDGSSAPTWSILASPGIAGWTDTKSHHGGVTAILPLPPTLVTYPDSTPTSESTVPILTGSYDDTLRLYQIHPTTLLRRLVLATPLGGGVWRLKLMDAYAVGTAQHFLVLASCMHAGVRIVRICYDDGLWSVDVVARFEKGHASMVYCCDFRKEEAAGAYTAVSTSFYDKRICTWGFVDEVRKRKAEQMKALGEVGNWEG